MQPHFSGVKIHVLIFFLLCKQVDYATFYKLVLLCCFTLKLIPFLHPKQHPFNNGMATIKLVLGSNWNRGHNIFSSCSVVTRTFLCNQDFNQYRMFILQITGILYLVFKCFSKQCAHNSNNSYYG